MYSDLAVRTNYSSIEKIECMPSKVKGSSQGEGRKRLVNANCAVHMFDIEVDDLSAITFTEKCRRHKAVIAGYLRRQTNVYLLTGMHGNVGDRLIWAGTRDLLDQERILYREISLNGLQTNDRCKGTLVIPGSGAWTESWHEWLPAAAQKGADIFTQVIVLPSQFDPNVDAVRQCLSRENVYAFAREVKSYRLIKGIGRATLSFDCALYYSKLTSAAPEPPQSRRRLLVALRTDKDSELWRHGLAPNCTVNIDISRRLSSLDSWMRAINMASTVITDRLHVAVAAVLLGKHVYAFDPINHKISTYFSYVFSDLSEEHIRMVNPDELITLEAAVRSSE
jgi:exopolysaccharide biosynthesis predicted pyruvyltransferase EpsI